MGTVQPDVCRCIPISIILTQEGAHRRWRRSGGSGELRGCELGAAGAVGVEAPRGQLQARDAEARHLRAGNGSAAFSAHRFAVQKAWLIGIHLAAKEGLAWP